MSVKISRSPRNDTGVFHLLKANTQPSPEWFLSLPKDLSKAEAATTATTSTGGP
ncbi:MAG: hypothetical protein GWP17_03715 [Aquificales bacterium]|nr:hypothetical protein [Aquificales bacterium]